MGRVRKRRAVGAKPRDMIAEISKAANIEVEEAVVLALLAAIFGDIEIILDDCILSVKKGQVCVIGHLT